MLSAIYARQRRSRPDAASAFAFAFAFAFSRSLTDVEKTGGKNLVVIKP